MPKIPADLEICFERMIGPPPVGVIEWKEVQGKVADLKLDNDKKRSCGRRLICWYEELEAGLDDKEPRKPARPYCKIKPKLTA